MSSQTSPRAPRSSGIQNFAAGIQHSTEDIRDVIKAELQGRIRYDSATVLSRLRTDDVDDAFVSRCRAGFETDLSVQYAVKTLHDIEKLAELSRTDSERQKQEKLMYQPLVCCHNLHSQSMMLMGRRQLYWILYALSLGLLSTRLRLPNRVV